MTAQKQATQKRKEKDYMMASARAMKRKQGKTFMLMNAYVYMDPLWASAQIGSAHSALQTRSSNDRSGRWHAKQQLGDV